MFLPETFEVNGLEFPLFPFRTDQWGKDLRTANQLKANKIHYSIYNYWKIKDDENDPFRQQEAAQLTELWVGFSDYEMLKVFNIQVAKGMFR